MTQIIIDPVPYEDRARIALALFWSAAVSENNDVATAATPVYVFQREGGVFDGSTSGMLRPYAAAQSNMFVAFGEWLSVWHLNRPGGPSWEDYYGDMAEVAAEMCEVASEIGYESDIENIYRLRAAAVDRIDERKPCKHERITQHHTNATASELAGTYFECDKCGWGWDTEAEVKAACARVA